LPLGLATYGIRIESRSGYELIKQALQALRNGGTRRCKSLVDALVNAIQGFSVLDNTRQCSKRHFQIGHVLSHSELVFHHFSKKDGERACQKTVVARSVSGA